LEIEAMTVEVVGIGSVGGDLSAETWDTAKSNPPPAANAKSIPTNNFLMW
jgi:hypothetical protein